MTQSERRRFLISKLIDERHDLRDLVVPSSPDDQSRLLRSLMNVRMPMAIDDEFLKVQDEYLQEELSRTGVKTLSDLTPVNGDLYLWQGDITKLACGAIVNAANSGMTGCYIPCHACIDNCIHSFSGIQLRLECDALMQKQGHPEPSGQAKITRAYNLP